MVSVTSKSNGSVSQPSLPLSLAVWEDELSLMIGGGLLDVGADFSSRSDLFDLGLDSMAIMQLLILIEERFGLVLPAEAVTREHFQNVESLAKLLQSCVAS